MVVASEGLWILLDTVSAVLQVLVSFMFVSVCCVPELLGGNDGVMIYSRT